MAKLNKDKELDKFYTNPNIVDEVIDLLKTLFKENHLNIDEFNFIEPSSGAGAFIQGLNRNLEKPNIQTYDIEPEGENIIKADFLNVEPKYSGKNIVIGNPPFGYKGDLAVKFINKSAEWSPIIIFVLPIQFRRYNIQKKINDNLKLIKSSGNLPKNSFTLSGKAYNVNCLIQVWVDKFSGYFLNEKDIRLYKPLPNKHKDFKLFIHNNTKTHSNILTRNITNGTLL